MILFSLTVFINSILSKDNTSENLFYSEYSREFTFIDEDFFEEGIEVERDLFKDDEITEVEELVEQKEEFIPRPAGRWVYMKVTAYSPFNAYDKNSRYQDGFTSTMVNTQSGRTQDMYGIAACPRTLPYGTRIFIPEYHEMLSRNRTSVPAEPWQKVDDTGSYMRRFRPHWRVINGERQYIHAHIDLRFRLERTALRWGVKYIPVFVYSG